MQDILNALKMCLDWSLNTKFLNLPIIVYPVLFALFSLIGSFIKGKKE